MDVKAPHQYGAVFVLTVILLFAGPALVGGGAVVTAGGAYAAESDGKDNVRRTPSMRQNVFDKLERARDKADQGEYEKAQKILDSLLNGSGLNSYERAMAWNLKAYVYYGRDQYSQTARAYRKVLEQDNLPRSLEQNTLYSLTKLYLVQEQYKKALPIINRWFSLVENPGAEAWILKGQIHYQMGDYQKALEPIRKAIALGEKSEGKPAENWYLLARAVYYQLNDYEGLRDVLSALVRYYPKRQYWIQLAAVYGELGQSKKQVAALETAYEQGLFEKESDYTMLARQFLNQDVPYKAARVLKQGLEKKVVEANAENLRLLADAWIMAKEDAKAVAAMERAAAKADTGEMHLRLAQIQLGRGGYAKALEAAKRALEKGGLDRPDRALVVKGLALFNLDKLDAARVAFREARSYEKSRETAKQWLSYIEREAKRKKQLRSSAGS